MMKFKVVEKAILDMQQFGKGSFLVNFIVQK